jgi:hypothetical protein
MGWRAPDGARRRTTRTGDAVVAGESRATDEQETGDLLAQNVELRARLATATTDLAASRASIAALEDRLRAAHRELDDYRHQLRLMRGSRSWRVTRPLRILKQRSADSPVR